MKLIQPFVYLVSFLAYLDIYLNIKDSRFLFWKYFNNDKNIFLLITLLSLSMMFFLCFKKENTTVVSAKRVFGVLFLIPSFLLMN